MEKFMYIFRDPSERVGQSSAEAMQASMQKWFAWIEKLQKSGNYEGGEPLLPSGKRINAKKVVTDGPFTESKELVSGYFVVLANDLTEATEMAKACPIFESGGSVEVRPVQKM